MNLQNYDRKIIEAYISEKYKKCSLDFLKRSIATQLIGIIGIVELILGILNYIPFIYGIIALTLYTVTSLVVVIFYCLVRSNIKEQHQELIEATFWAN